VPNYSTLTEKKASSFNKSLLPLYLVRATRDIVARKESSVGLLRRVWDDYEEAVKIYKKVIRGGGGTPLPRQETETLQHLETLQKLWERREAKTSAGRARCEISGTDMSTSASSESHQRLGWSRGGIEL